MKSQVLEINSNIAGGEARPFRKWVGFVSPFIFSLICLLDSQIVVPDIGIL